MPARHDPTASSDPADPAEPARGGTVASMPAAGIDGPVGLDDGDVTDVAVRRVAAEGPAGPVLLLDSVTQLEPADAGAWVVTGSHGGISAARYALACPLTLVVFNDAGVGKDGAGIAALDRLQARGRAAATVSHDSARIGDARDAWAHGVVSHANAAAKALGVRPGQPLRAAVLQAAQGAPRPAAS